jgi:hypothetical protein
MTTTKFKTGNIYATPGVNQHIPSVEVLSALARHSRGDWGTVGEEDRQENELSLVEGYRIFSVYEATDGTKFWIITEADRSSTTVLLPEEY